VDPLLASLILILLALLGARFSFGARRVPSGVRLILKTGTHFLLFGFILGPAALGLVSSEAVRGLSPFLGLALGWIGLLFGLQLDRSVLRQFPRSYTWIALGQATLTFLLCWAAGVGAGHLFGPRHPVVPLMVLGAAATACVSTPAGIAVVSANFLAKGEVRRLLLFVASLDGVVGITALHTAYAAFHDSSILVTEYSIGWWAWLLGGVLLGVVCAVIFLWLIRLRPSVEELVLYLLGISALAGGAALQLQLSPLFVAMVMGAVISNVHPAWHRVFRVMERWEKPIYVILLLLAGATLRFPTWWVLPLAGAYAAVRGAAKVIATGIMVTAARLPAEVPRSLGLGLLSQGGISIAMTLSLSLTLSANSPVVSGFSARDVLFASVVLGIILSEAVGPLMAAGLLRRVGEIAPEVEEAIEEGDEAKAVARARGRPAPDSTVEPGRTGPRI
jgi:hypothetical protein